MSIPLLLYLQWLRPSVPPPVPSSLFAAQAPAAALSRLPSLGTCRRFVEWIASPPPALDGSCLHHHPAVQQLASHQRSLLCATSTVVLPACACIRQRLKRAQGQGRRGRLELEAPRGGRPTICPEPIDVHVVPGSGRCPALMIMNMVLRTQQRFPTYSPLKSIVVTIDRADMLLPETKLMSKPY